MLETVISIAAGTALDCAAILYVLLAERRQPTATLAWILTVVFLPIFGFVLYLLFGKRRSRKVAAQSSLATERLDDVMERYGVEAKLGSEAAPRDPHIEGLLALGDRLASMRASRCNGARILVDARRTYSAMEAAVDAADDHVHVEFYIIQPDVTGRLLRDKLVECAERGVEVRVLCDGLGSMALPDEFWDPLTRAGGRAATFNPVHRWRRWFGRRDRVDFRNHRKIVVTDGRIGFTGGINVGREYLGLDPARGSWRDTHMELAGPAALALQRAFAEDWLKATGELLDDVRYFPEPEPAGSCVVQIIDSGPDRTWSPIEHVYVQAISLACERVWITSPYFVPSPSMEYALVSAALRGVDVRLLLPVRPDSRLVMFASASFREPLLDAGIRIFLYREGFVHAKTMVVDDWVATVGSANMDMRSFHLNFELNAFVYGKEFAEELAAQYELDLEQATEVDAEHESRIGFATRIVRAGARLASPML